MISIMCIFFLSNHCAVRTIRMLCVVIQSFDGCTLDTQGPGHALGGGIDAVLAVGHQEEVVLGPEVPDVTDQGVPDVPGVPKDPGAHDETVPGVPGVNGQGVAVGRCLAVGPAHLEGLLVHQLNVGMAPGSRDLPALESQGHALGPELRGLN